MDKPMTKRSAPSSPRLRMKRLPWSIRLKSTQ
ncbi:Uncharacterised protein [Mycobacteroides abscessus subsp. abscessus]|nr:Uncharacterised protein [Mycobacteroides abscessus subsp. abscessus]